MVHGKTTTIKMILGMLYIDSGSIKINSFDVKNDFEKAIKNVGGIVESPDLYEYMSGLDNLKLFARVHKVSNEKINEIVKLVNLESRIKDKVSKYSLGMKQRLGLAVSLLHNPKLLVLDEPTNGLDPAGMKEFRDIFKKLSAKGVSIFISSHLLSEMQMMCDKIAVLDNGKIVKIETLDDAINSNESFEYRLVTSDNNKCVKLLNCEVIDSNDKFIDIKLNEDLDIASILIKENIRIYEIFKKNNLESAFLKLTKESGK
ncbi:MAG: ABC transporter ATP-binding protein [Clostridia bacterium]